MLQVFEKRCLLKVEESLDSPDERMEAAVARRGERVSRLQILLRGLALRCPNCGAGTLFRRPLAMHERCARCGLLFEREEGFFLGAMVFNYTFTALIAGVVPCIILLAGLAMAPLSEQIRLFVIAIVAGATLPFLLYHPSKSWWMMTFYFFLPNDLPANGGKQEANETLELTDR
jgi:uncharacterized protein (DUF983 family)